MAVSPLLNDLALAAATDRTTASRKAQSKSQDRDFGSALFATRRENADAATAPKRSPDARPQSKPDPRDQRSSEIPRSERSRDDYHETKTDAPRDHIRHDAKHDTRADHGSRHAAHSKANDGASEPNQTNASTAETSLTATSDTVSDTDKTKTAGEIAEKAESTSLDPSALLQTIAPVPAQVIQPLTIPVEVQFAALIDGVKIEPPKADSGEETAQKAIIAQTAAIGANITASTQSSIRADIADGKAAPLVADKAAQSNIDFAASKTLLKAAASEEVKIALASVETTTTQPAKTTSEQSVSFAERVSTTIASNEATTAATADKSASGISGLSAALSSGTAESAHIMKAPAATPSEAMARADAPVPLQAVAVEIGMRAMRGSKEFSIRLDPEDLGRIDIKLEISEAGEVQAKLVVDRVETLQLLQRDAKTLERAFDQAGLKTNPDGLQFTLRDPGQQREGQQDQQAERSKFKASENDLNALEETTLRTFRYTSPASSGLDIRI
jgi:flagellar hook-length control protein FliK